MKVQHLTVLSHNRPVRDTFEILPNTKKFFEFLGIKEGKKLEKIPETTLTCRITVAGGIAIFDLLENDMLLFVNVCCFRKEDKEDCMKYVDALVKKMPFGASETINPTEACFIYTVPVMPFTDSKVLQLCGEIELYIFNALYNAK